MGKYKVEFSKSAVKEYRKLPGNYKSIIDLALLKLSEGLTGDIKPIKGEKDIFRLRIGRYRVLFLIIGDVLLVTKVGTRGDVYK